MGMTMQVNMSGNSHLELVLSPHILKTTLLTPSQLGLSIEVCTNNPCMIDMFRIINSLFSIVEIKKKKAIR